VIVDERKSTKQEKWHQKKIRKRKVKETREHTHHTDQITILFQAEPDRRESKQREIDFMLQFHRNYYGCVRICLQRLTGFVWKFNRPNLERKRSKILRFQKPEQRTIKRATGNKSKLLLWLCGSSSCKMSTVAVQLNSGPIKTFLRLQEE